MLCTAGRDIVFPQVYRNMKVMQGLRVYAARLTGELKRAERDLAAHPRDATAIHQRRAHYEQLLAAVEIVGRSLGDTDDWIDIQPKVTQLEACRTEPGDLRHHILHILKYSPEPLTVNAIHDRLIVALALKLSKQERRKHRAVVVDALHAMRRGPPALLEAMEKCCYGEFGNVEQRWKLRQLR